MDLSQLASVLRENGDQVLNGISKLSLSTKLLTDLNESFNLIVEDKETLSSTFQVINTNSKVDLLLDIQFLHDFVQRTLGLKLINDHSDLSELLSISKFKNLRLLEIRKVPVAHIVGLQFLRNQLQCLVAVRCLQNLSELFINCGADKSQAYIWSELKEAVLSYNNIVAIDNSFEYVPWLQILDLSHNQLTNAQTIDCLPNLKHLNLSFNHLEAIPEFKREPFRNLQIFNLKSNYVEDITGVIYLDNLVTLDLSCNCLIDHKSLKPLSHLAALQWLNLEGNPLSFHSDHRSITARYLHPNTITVNFSLDRLLLNKSEKLLIGTYHNEVKLFGQSRREHLSSVSSNLSELTNSSEVTTIAASELTRSMSTQRVRKVRDAIISEESENNDTRDTQGNIVDSSLVKSITSVSSIPISNDHVETQKKIESLREEYGSEWLKSQGGSIMQDILGLEKLPDQKIVSSTPYEEDFLTHAAEVFETKPEPSIESVQSVNDNADDGISEMSANNTFLTASESSVFEDTKGQTLEVDSNVSNEYHSDADDEDEEGHPYLAQIIYADKKCDPEEIFIIITDKYIKERDISGRTRSKWLLEVILSCEIISNNPTKVHIEFDTVRRNMKQREYILEEDEAQKFFRAVSDITSKRPLNALNQTIYSCMKCSLQFTRNKNLPPPAIEGDKTNLSRCPNCKSTLIYEVDDDSTPTNHIDIEMAQNIERAESPSECSIASESDGNQLAQIHVTADVHMDSTATNMVSIHCSAASVQESTSSHISADENNSGEHLMRKYESDIEVISNPSQSSIEVLDDHFRPGRKRSSEERRTIVAPTLGTIPDIVLPTPNTLLGGLTESSSSSSFTESVCTAYDTHVNPSTRHTRDAAIPEEHDAPEKAGNLITSLFEGLFSGPTTGKKAVEKNENDIQFSFTEDFSNLDHRIKLHLYQNVFEDGNENFVWLLRCVLFSLQNINTGQPNQGCLVLSTYKVYILHVKEHNDSDDLSKWLVKKESYTIDRLQTMFTLPWKQGIGLEIRGANRKMEIHYLCILQDMQRTSNFLAFLADHPLPESCDLVCVCPERPMLNLQHLLLTCRSTSEHSTKDSTLNLLSVLVNCTVTINNEAKSFCFGVFLVTSTDLILLENLSWLLPDANIQPKIFATQPITNLLEMNVESLTSDFHFLDEIAGCEEVWTIQWETDDILRTIISAVKSPWEEIFSVPLQINNKADM